MSNKHTNAIRELVLNIKYRPILISLLVLTLALATLLLVNYQFAKRATIATEHMDLIGNISDSTLFIATDSQQLPLMLNKADPAKLNKAVADLKAEAKAIDDYLVELKKYEQKETAMQDFESLWQAYRTKIYAISPNSSLEQLTDLANYAYEQKVPIWDFMDVGYDAYLNESIRLSDYSRYLQVGAFLGLVLYLLFFIGYALSRLRASDAQVALAQKATDDIMKTVNEGLFLVDKDFVIDGQYSAKLATLLTQETIAGRTLIELLRPMISAKDLENAQLFIEQLYNSWVVEELIQDLNPLKEVLVSYIDKDGVSQTKFLSFNFSRVVNSDTEQIEKVFVSVGDVTQAVQLQRQMAQNQQAHDRQIEMISYLLTVDNQQIRRFIAETRQRIERMNNALKDNLAQDLKQKAQQLFREMHSLKGDASAMKLDSVIGLAEAQETKLKALIEHPSPTGNDFLGFTIGLNELIELVDFIDTLQNKLSPNTMASPTKTPQTISDSLTTINALAPQSQTTPSFSWQSYFNQYATDIAQRQGKQVAMTVKGFELINHAPSATISLYKDIAVQLIKNAIVHGIELPKTRQAIAKPSVGNVSVSLQPFDNERVQLMVEDDGHGIDWQKLRQKAIETGQISIEQAKQLQPKDYIRLLFAQGLSTATHQDEDAGRGVGMDIVRQLVVDAHGKIAVNSQANQFTRFTITLPKNIHL